MVCRKKKWKTQIFLKMVKTVPKHLLAGQHLPLLGGENTVRRETLREMEDRLTASCWTCRIYKSSTGIILGVAASQESIPILWIQKGEQIFE